MRKAVLSFMVVLMSMSGCGKRQTVVYNLPEVHEGGYYEKAWVEPEIIYSDTLYTIIRADWVDSFYVDRSENPLKALVPSLEFYVGQTECFTWISSGRAFFPTFNGYRGSSNSPGDCCREIKKRICRSIMFHMIKVT